MFVDYEIFRLLNGAMRGHATVDHAVSDFADWIVPLFAAATVGLWLLWAPGRSPRWKLASVSALASAGLGLLVNQAIGHAWFRQRPFAAHPAATVLLAQRSPDPSFPSDHATAAFAIAFAVAAFSLRAGLAFILGAVLIAFSRIFVGLHYPGDVAAGAAIGLVCALVVTTVLARPVALVVALASRVTDPVVRAATTRLGRARQSLPG